jgi:aryl-alcohol dehydrogenase-like predicted oxidoreductase
LKIPPLLWTHQKKARVVVGKPQCGTHLDQAISRRAAPSQLRKLLSTHELEANRMLISGARFASCALAYCNIQSHVASAILGMEKHKKRRAAAAAPLIFFLGVVRFLGVVLIRTCR